MPEFESGICVRCGHFWAGDYAAHAEHHCPNPSTSTLRTGDPLKVNVDRTAYTLPSQALVWAGVAEWLRELLQAADAELEGMVVLGDHPGMRPAHAIAAVEGKFCLLGKQFVELQEIDFDKAPKQLVAEIKALLVPSEEELYRRAEMVMETIQSPSPSATALCRDQLSDRVCKLPAGHPGNHTDGQGQWVDSFTG